jgi:hypothetical protein
MMVRKKVLDELGGYDENLAYEDFDFWVRSARRYRYAYWDEKLTQIRRGHRSLSTGLYQPGDRQLQSTYQVCLKIRQMNRDEKDTQALVIRVRYEFRQAVYTGNTHEAGLFFGLLKNLQAASGFDQLILLLGKYHMPFSFFRRLYYRWRYQIML